MNFAPLLLLAATAATAPVASPVKQGVDYWQAGDFDRATKTWMTPAQAGDADAQFNLAQAYKLGRGLPMDMRQAENWYRRAAEQNHPQAGAMLGLIMFQNGDRKGAMPWIARAAERGDPRAQYVYGTALFNGDEIAKDWPRAYALMTKAAAAGLPQAATSLGQMDHFIPLPDREAGMRLAKGNVRVAGAEAATRMPKPTLIAAQAPAVRSTDLPPSRVAEPAQARLPSPLAKEPKPLPPRGAPVAAAAAVRTPSPVVAATVPAAVPAGGGWRIQLGAYANSAAADAQWGKLSGKPALKQLQSFKQKAGSVTRLQAGPFATRAAAAQACKAVVSGGGACFPLSK